MTDNPPPGPSTPGEEIPYYPEQPETVQELSAHELTALIDDTPAAIGALDRGFRLRFVNEAACQLFGRLRDDLVGRSIAEVLGEGRFTRLRAQLERALPGEAVHLEEIEPNRFGPCFDRVTDQVYTAQLGRDGTVTGWSFFISDISERRSTERDLRKSATHYRAALEIETVGVVFTNLNGRITEMNDAFLKRCGFTRAEVEAGELYIHDITPRHWLPATQLVNRRLAAKSRAAPYEREFFRRDGSTWWGLVAPKLLGDDLIVEFVLDVTARKQTQVALRASEASLRTVTNLVPDLLWRSAPDGSTTWYNDRWYAYTGQTPAEAFGWGWAEAIHPDDRAGSTTRYAAMAMNGTPLMQEHRIRRHDGVYHWFVVHAEPLRDETGQIVQWFGAATDIHEARVAREELEARVAAATAELRTLSRRLLLVQEEERRRLALELHDEIGQVLTGLGFQLSSGTATDAGRLAEARRITQELTEQVRQLSMDLRPASLDAYGLLPALRWHGERFERQTGIRVELRQEGLDQRFPAPVEIAAFRIVQEAMTNAARYSGTATVRIQMLADDQMLTVSVRDEGHGFESGKTRDGTGLGGMRERAELLGGTLDIETSPGHGVTIMAELPLTDHLKTFKDESVPARD